jgi:superfamily I DNA/RNA helicase
VEEFCRSAEFEMGLDHVHFMPGANRSEQAEVILESAQTMWADLINPERNMAKFGHDHYRKLWQLSEPKIRADFLMLDEAQDTAPVVQQVVAAQTHLQQIIVGDSAQQLYAWAGAVDALKNWTGDVERLYLTKSWRFGSVIATEANKWLSLLDTPLRLTGNDAFASELGDVDEPDAILCRTNVGAFSEVLSQLATGRKVALAGGGKAMAAMARAARDLMDGRGTRHSELSAFGSWDEVVAYAREEGADAGIRALVRLIEDFGPNAVDDTMRKLSDPRDADVTVSTGHKAKGLEWGTVRIANDFQAPEEGEEISQADANLAYVAVTRAQMRLERGPLSFIDNR